MNGSEIGPVQGPDDCQPSSSPAPSHRRKHGVLDPRLVAPYRKDVKRRKETTVPELSLGFLRTGPLGEATDMLRGSSWRGKISRQAYCASSATMSVVTAATQHQKEDLPRAFFAYSAISSTTKTKVRESVRPSIYAENQRRSHE